MKSNKVFTSTAGTVFQLAASKTVHLEFRVPGSSLLSPLSAPPDGFPVSILQHHNVPRGSIRVQILPLVRGDYFFPLLAHKYLTVVLDRPGFALELGVLYFILLTDSLQDRPLPETGPNVSDIWHSAVIPEASRRLTVIAVKEGIRKPRRNLAKEDGEASKNCCSRN